jgi:hypothetical protein
MGWRRSGATWGSLSAAVRVQSLRGDGTWLTLQLTGRLRARGEPDPLRFTGDGAHKRFQPPETLRRHVREAELDTAGALADPATVVFLKSLADGSEWDLPTERRIRLVDAGEGTLRPQLRMLARIAPTIAAAGAPLPAGRYEVRAIVAVAGFSSSARVTREGEPFTVTVMPSHRLEPTAPAPPQPPAGSRARRRVARAARRIPGLVPAVRRARSRIGLRTRRPSGAR